MSPRIGRLPSVIKRLALVAAGTLLAVLPTVQASADSTTKAPPFTLAVYGDSPYGTTPTDTAQLQATPAFINSINADPDVSEVVHVGDIHSGKQYCTQSYDQTIKDLWTAFQDPLVYTPGDNEWTDCHKAGEGGNVTDANGNYVDYANGNPVANLALVRSLFFPVAGRTLGGVSDRVHSQAELVDLVHPNDSNYVENVWWVKNGVLFVTVNIPGGSNNDADVWYGASAMTPQQQQEIADRTGADLRWLDTAFQAAQDKDIKAVVVGEQADMWDVDGKTAAHLTGYEPFVASLASHTNALGKPVLLLNGDSHVYNSDNPFDPSDPVNATHPGYTVPNFHRITVHGGTFPLEWLKLTFDPNASNPTTATTFGPFSWSRQVQP